MILIEVPHFFRLKQKLLLCSFVQRRGKTAPGLVRIYEKRQSRTHQQSGGKNGVFPPINAQNHKEGGHEKGGQKMPESPHKRGFFKKTAGSPL